MKFVRDTSTSFFSKWSSAINFTFFKNEFFIRGEKYTYGVALFWSFGVGLFDDFVVFENKIYVALSGYLDGSTGESSLVQLSYDAAGVLTLDWESGPSDLTQLHGIDISENGEYIYVSSRDGRIFKFRSVSGDLLAVMDLSASTAPGGIKYNY